MELEIKPKARDELRAMDKSLRQLFGKHIDKLESMPPRHHMQHGLPCHEKVTDSARIIYDSDGQKLIILRCFATHKEYERWFRSFG